MFAFSWVSMYLRLIVEIKFWVGTAAKRHRCDAELRDVGWLEHKGVGAGIVAMDLVVNAGRNQ